MFTLGYLLIDLLMVGLSIPLLRRRVKPNEIYGLRVGATLADAWVWYEANAKSARDLIVFAGAHALLTVVIGLVPTIDEGVQVAVVTGAAVLGVLIVAFIGWKHANRLLERRQASTH